MDDDGDDFDFEPENKEAMGVLYALLGGWFLYIAFHMHLGFAGRPAKDVLARVFVYALNRFHGDRRSPTDIGGHLHADGSHNGPAVDISCHSWDSVAGSQ